MLVFAYGSNMYPDQMRERCPSAQFVCAAKLPDHELVFPRKSIKRGCGVASVEARDKAEVWGAVYQIDELDVGHLDKSEGFAPGRERNSYTREERQVLRDGEENDPLTVWVYIAQTQENPPKPSAEYKSKITEGARHWHLPDDYVRRLEEIETE